MIGKTGLIRQYAVQGVSVAIFDGVGTRGRLERERNPSLGRGTRRVGFAALNPPYSAL